MPALEARSKGIPRTCVKSDPSLLCTDTSRVEGADALDSEHRTSNSCNAAWTHATSSDRPCPLPAAAHHCLALTDGSNDCPHWHPGNRALLQPAQAHLSCMVSVKSAADEPASPLVTNCVGSSIQHAGQQMCRPARAGDRMHADRSVAQADCQPAQALVRCCQYLFMYVKLSEVPVKHL